jgi:hypothetical protein
MHRNSLIFALAVAVVLAASVLAARRAFAGAHPAAPPVAARGAAAIDPPHAKKKPAPVKPKPATGAPGAAPVTSGSAGPSGSAAPAAAAGADDDGGVIETKGGTARVDFSEATIEATGAKAGAVYLYERSDSDLLSIVRLRTSYRDELVRTVFSPGDAEPKPKAKTPKPSATPAATPAAPDAAKGMLKPPPPKGKGK